MRSHLPPIEIDGFQHPHALTGIAERRRPDWGHTRCTTCSGRGARNDLLHLDTLRCRIAPCSDCEGSGWKSINGVRHRQDIVMRDGHPCWVVEIVSPVRALPPCLLPGNLVPQRREPLREYAQAA